MKNLKSLIITLMLLLAASTNAGAQQHLKFMGIPLTGTIDQFQSKLAAKGIRPDKQFNRQSPFGTRMFIGMFTGKKCNIHVYYTKSKTVYRAKAVYSDTDEEVADRYFDDIKQMLQSKYALEQSESGTTADGYPVFRIYVTTDAGNYLGEIDLFKSKYTDSIYSYYTSYSVHVDYFDGANYSKQQNSNMDDL